MSNPYTSPQQPQYSKPRQPQKPGGLVMAPAITLIVLASIGLLAAIIGCVSAAIGNAPPIDPTAPPFFQEMQKNQVGPLAASIQAGFAILNIVILIGAIQMLRFKMWGFALTVSILSILNVGNCCCIFGAPVGIWSIIVLSQARVKSAFK